MSLDLNQLIEANKKTLGHHLGMEFIALDKQRVVIKMPVDDRHRQPYGLLHGGASVALAETVASVGGWSQVADQGLAVVGLEINANHLRPVKGGWVQGEGKPLHLGKRTQVWEVHITDEKGQLVCVSRCTLAVINPKEH